MKRRSGGFPNSVALSFPAPARFGNIEREVGVTETVGQLVGTKLSNPRRKPVLDVAPRQPVTSDNQQSAVRLHD